MTLPAGFGYTTVLGKYISAVLDSADPDREPDVVPLANLTVTLTPSVGGSLLKSLADPPMTIVLAPITAKTDANGEIVGPDGQPGIVIVASDYPDPTRPWTYAVSVTGVGLPKLSFSIVAHSGETIDLTSVLEVPSSGTDLSTWQALALQVSQDADRAEAAAAAAESGGGGTGGGAVSSVAGRTGDVTLTSDDLTDVTVTGKAVITAADAATARTFLGAGTSDLVLGTTAGTAKAGDYQPSAANITDATSVGRSVLTAASATAARSAIGAGTSNIVIGTGAGTAADAAATATALAGKEPNITAGQAGQYWDGTKTWQPFPIGGAITADSITDATVTGRSLIRATDATAARTAIGAGTSNLAIGTTASTAKAGNYQPTAANISDSTATGRSVLTAADAAAARTAIGAGTGSSNLALGTTSTTAKAGDYQPTAANISDSTATGRSVLTAASAASARTAIGAGTSSVAIGITAGTAADAAAVTASLAGKEPTITAGTTAQYWRGDKTWQTLPPAPVTSVNGNVGAVTLTASDVGAADATATATALAGKEPNLPSGGTVSQYLRGDKSWQNLPSAPVTSVNSRTGAVVVTAADVGLANVQDLAVYVLAVGAPDPTGASPAGLYVRQTS